ncbi:MAG: thiamine phosphate synthase [Candidatus Magnetominusculus sp. LBB02]|nr:thiamine phosphate synthase [Candidatus Magnetominusculus sp. LBB02]
MDTTGNGRPPFDTIIELIGAGVAWIQLRDKVSSRLAVYKAARLLKALAKANGVALIINDYADIAAAVDADGVHLGQSDLPIAEARKIVGSGKLIGISTHSLEQAVRAQEDGADYIGFGPIYSTATKKAGPPQGLSPLAELRGHIHIPITAIGGITDDNVGELLEAGARAVAVSSAIMDAEDVSKAAADFVSKLRAVRQ